MVKRESDRLRLFWKWSGACGAVLCVVCFVGLIVPWVVTWDRYRQVRYSSSSANYSMSVYAGVLYLARTQEFEMEVVLEERDQTVVVEREPVLKARSPEGAGSVRWSVGDWDGPPYSGKRREWPVLGFFDVSSHEMPTWTVEKGVLFAAPVYALELFFIVAGICLWRVYRKNRWGPTCCRGCGHDFGDEAKGEHCPQCGLATALPVREGLGARMKRVPSAVLRFGLNVVRVGVPLLFVLAVIMWIRGYWVCDIVGMSVGRDYVIVSHNGAFWFERRIWYQNPSETDPSKLVEAGQGRKIRPFYQHWPAEYCPFPPQTPMSYFTVYKTWPLFFSKGASYHGRAVGVPSWLVAGVLLAGAAGVVMKRKKRWPAGHCQGCGYNLAGNPGSGVCPECGRGVSR